jgi:hypothetical protein
LRPGIYREQIDKLVNGLAELKQKRDEDTDTDRERLRLERHLSQDFQVEAAGLLNGHETRQELYFLQQHYGLPTRLLDWTHRPLPALWFATNDTDAEPGAVFIIDAYNLAGTQSEAIKLHTREGERPFQGIASARHPCFAAEINSIFDWQDRESLPFIMPVRPDHTDCRVRRQHSCFTFHSSAKPELTKCEASSLMTLTIPSGDAKRRIRDELFALGIDAFEVYGDLPNLAKRLKTAHNIPAPGAEPGLTTPQDVKV